MSAPHRPALGRRPAFSSDPQVDRLMSIVMALATELSVTRDRLDTVERLAESKGLFGRDEIEGFPVDETVYADREARRADFLDRVLWIMREELDQVRAEPDGGK